MYGIVREYGRPNKPRFIWKRVEEERK